MLKFWSLPDGGKTCHAVRDKQARYPRGELRRIGQSSRSVATESHESESLQSQAVDHSLYVTHQGRE